MHLKFTVITPHGTKTCCVIDKEKDLEYQLEDIVRIGHGHGLAVHLEKEWINVVDYYHAENMAEYKILSVEETDAPLSTGWETVEE